MDWSGSKEAGIRRGCMFSFFNRIRLANTVESSMCGSDVSLLSNYSVHLLVSLSVKQAVSVHGMVWSAEARVCTFWVISGETDWMLWLMWERKQRKSSKFSKEWTQTTTHIIYIFKTFFCYRNVDGETTPCTVMFLIRLIFFCAAVNAQAIVPVTILRNNTTLIMQNNTSHSHS